MILLELNDNLRKTKSLLENTGTINTPIYAKYKTMKRSPYEMGNISDTDWIYGNTENKMSYFHQKRETVQHTYMH